MFRKVILSLFLCFIFSGVVFAQNLKVNNQLVHEGDNLNLFFENLDAGKIVFYLEAKDLKKAEITFDKGRSWLEMEQEGDYFVYRYRPLSNEVFFPEMLLTDKNQGAQTYRPNLRINYQKERPDRQLEQFLEKFKSFYEDENKDRFLSLFSMIYPDRVKFEQAIQNDFYNYKNMRLFYRIDNRAFDDDQEGAIWDVYWQRKYQDRNGNDLAESTANIAMRFDKESGQWMITGLRNNTIFGSSLLAAAVTQADLNVFSLNVTDGTNPPAYTADIAAVIRNSGNADASNVTVKYYKQRTDPVADPAFILVATQIIASIPAGTSVADAVVTYGALPELGGNYSFKVVVDPDNTISESDETNNTATAVHNIGP